MKIGVVRFPGSNCDADCFELIAGELGLQAVYLWHEEKSISDCDCVILPGGFSFGDYLRTGALASLSPIMDAVKELAERGGAVLGICNGFQMLTEADLLPGVLMRNSSRSFICRSVPLRVESTETPFTTLYSKREIIHLPIAHGEGRFYADEKTCKTIEQEGLVVFRYAGENGEAGEEWAPNGSLHGIAGIRNRRGNVLGLMPHPERASSSALGNTDGLRFWQGILNYTLARR